MRDVAFAAIFAACLCLPGIASATDLYEQEPPEYTFAPIPIWAGFYFGGHIGGANGEADIKDVFDYNGDPEANNALSSSGVIAGVQFGYNVQRGNLVLGVEADLGYLDLSDSKTVDLPNPTGKHNNDIRSTYSISGDLYGDLTARVGYASGDTLLYLKGGAAFLNADFSADYVGENCTTKADHACGPRDPSAFEFGADEMLLGWTLGAGVEFALDAGLSMKLEYQHFDFGDISYSDSGKYDFENYCGGTYQSKLTSDTDVSTAIDVVKVGLNYRIGGGGQAPFK